MHYNYDHNIIVATGNNLLYVESYTCDSARLAAMCRYKLRNIILYITLRNIQCINNGVTSCVSLTREHRLLISITTWIFEHIIQWYFENSTKHWINISSVYVYIMCGYVWRARVFVRLCVCVYVYKICVAQL